MSRLLILGANSFAGSCFVDYCVEHDHDVIGINRSAETSEIFLPVKSNKKNENYNFIQLDLNKDIQKIIEEADNFEPEFIIDFAGQGMVAESWINPYQWYETNIVSKAKLHRHLINKKYLKKYLRISTPEVYGSNEKLISEKNEMNPSTPYAISHMATDLSILAFERNFGFPAVVGRFANFYGPHQQLYRIIPKAIISILNNKVLDLHGGGKSVRAFIHSKDVSRGIMRILESGLPGETYHFSPKDFYSIRDLVMMICDELDANFDKVTRVTEDRMGKDFAYLMDSSKSKLQLGWEAEVPFKKGITETINWVQQNLEEINTMNLEYLHKE